MSSLPKAKINLITNTARIGNIYKGYKIVNVIPLEPFTKKVKERICEGGGWYSGYEYVEKVFQHYLLVDAETNEKIGVVKELYTNMLSNIYPLSNYNN